MASFDSNFNITDSVTFLPRYAEEKMEGTIVSVKFTKTNVFYDIIDDYYGKVFTNIDSRYVYPIK